MLLTLLTILILWSIRMSVISKLDAIKADTAALLTAVAALSTGNNQPVLDAVSAVKTELDTLVATVGDNTP